MGNPRKQQDLVTDPKFLAGKRLARRLRELLSAGSKIQLGKHLQASTASLHSPRSCLCTACWSKSHLSIRAGRSNQRRTSTKKHSEPELGNTFLGRKVGKRLHLLLPNLDCTNRSCTGTSSIDLFLLGNSSLAGKFLRFRPKHQQFLFHSRLQVHTKILLGMDQ